MSHEDYERRQRIMDEVLDDVAASGGRRIPDRWRPEIDETFGDEASFALALYPRWFAALTARLDTVLETGSADLPDAAARVAGDLARERPALFAVLAAYCGDPELEDVRRRERQYLNWAPGAELTELASRLDDLLGEPDTGAAAVPARRRRLARVLA